MDTGDLRYAQGPGFLGGESTVTTAPMFLIRSSPIRSVLYLTNNVIRIESTAPMPSRWVRWWHRFLLGWRWEKPL